MFTKIKLIAAGVAILIALSAWSALKYYRHKAEVEQAKRIEAEKREEVKDDQREREKKVDGMSIDDLLNYWRGVPNRAKGGPAAPPLEASPGKSQPGR